MQTQLRKNIDAEHTHILTRQKREREERKDSTLTVEHSTTAMWFNLALLFYLCALTLAPAAACMTANPHCEFNVLNFSL